MQFLKYIPFIGDALREAYRQGGIDSFALAQKDILDTMRDDLDKKAVELAKEKLSTLLSAFDERKIITFDQRNKAVFIGGERVEDPGRLQSLRAEAEALVASDLWQVLYETPNKLAQKAMFIDDGTIENQLIKGRAMLYLLDTQKRILDTLISYQH